MNRPLVTRKNTLKKRSPQIILSKLSLSSQSSIEELSSDMVFSEIISPNPVRKSCVTKDLILSGAPIRNLPLSPSTPFGPKAKACIIPFKDLSNNSNTLELDQLEHYNIWSDIGRGSYATVKLATHKENMQKCAIKVYSKTSLEDKALNDNVMREIKILKMIEHPNVVKFYEEIVGENNLYIVMEYVKGIGLNNHLIAKKLKRLMENEACQIFTQVILALQYCHSKNITHRDIKLENIQLDLHFNVKLIDFGFATCFSNKKKQLIYCGSPSYMAPEIINKTEFLGPPVDIWACGVVLFLLVTGEFPFKSNNEKKVFEKVRKGTMSIPSYISPLCSDLIIKILQVNPEIRPSASEILDHPWIKSCGGSSVYAAPSLGDNIEVNDE